MHREKEKERERGRVSMHKRGSYVSGPIVLRVLFPRGVLVMEG